MTSPTAMNLRIPELNAAAGDWLLDEALTPDAENDVLKELYRGAARGELVLPFCERCDEPMELEQRVCDNDCGSRQIVWRAVAKTGTVHSVTTVHRFEPGLVKVSSPYPVLDVELSSGHRLVMTTKQALPRTLDIGDAVAITFRTLGGVAVPAAQPADQPKMEES